MRRFLTSTALPLAAAAFVTAGGSGAQQPVYNSSCGGIPCRVERLASPWEVIDVGLDLRALTVAYESGGCWRGNGRVTAVESGRRIQIAVEQDLIVAAATPDGSLPCTGDVVYRTLVLLLGREVGGRAIAGTPRLPAGVLEPSPTSPWLLDLRAADAIRALRVQRLRARRLGRATGRVAFQSPLPDKRLATRTVRLTVGRRLFRTRALDRCLERAGIAASPQTPRPGDADAPDLVMWLRGPGASGSVGLYRDPVRATALAPALRRVTRRTHGVFERRRFASISWYVPPDSRLRARTRRCVFGPLGRPRT